MSRELGSGVDVAPVLKIALVEGDALVVSTMVDMSMELGSDIKVASVLEIALVNGDDSSFEATLVLIAEVGNEERTLAEDVIVGLHETICSVVATNVPEADELVAEGQHYNRAAVSKAQQYQRTKQKKNQMINQIWRVCVCACACACVCTLLKANHCCCYLNIRFTF
jgi:hypothetical protein